MINPDILIARVKRQNPKGLILKVGTGQIEVYVALKKWFIQLIEESAAAVEEEVIIKEQE